jgi:hypothetical protein
MHAVCGTLNICACERFRTKRMLDMPCMHVVE